MSKSFLSELKRRNVYKVAAAYAVVAWLLIQAASILLPTFETPPWVMKVLVLLVILGFPAALILSWAFEITPEGIKLESEIDPNKSIARRTGRKIVAVTIALAVVAAGLFVFQRVRSRPDTSSSATEAGPHVIRSLAVLPLDNYSGDKSQDYFAEGMTDELTTDLATISQLRVISRSSTTQFKGNQRPPAPEMAKMLNVDAVVEGSVFRAGDKVRITAQLIDARADRHLWAKSFERNSRDVLELQNELASAIANEINVQLTPREQTRLATAPQVNPAAYDAYLKGRYFFNRPSDKNLGKAITQFEQAVALDPGFAPAHSGLSDAYLWAAFNEGVITTREGNLKAKAAAEKALALNPASAEAHTLWNLDRKEESDAALATLIKDDGDVGAFQIAEVYSGRGDKDKAFAWLERARRQQDGGLAYFPHDPLLDPLRSDPGWTTFERAMGWAEDQLK